MIAANQTVISEGYVFFSIKYRYSDILLKYINFIFSSDKTFQIINFTRAELTG